MKTKINILLIILILLGLYKLSPLLEVVEQKIMNPLLPFFVSFLIAYFLYPVKRSIKKKTNEIVSIIVVIFLLVLLIAFISFVLGPLIYREGMFLINTSIYLLKNISLKYNIDLSIFTKRIIESIDISSSYNVVVNVFVTFCLTIYLLIDMEKIRQKIREYFRDKKYYEVIVQSDRKIRVYTRSLLLISVITFFEYFIIYGLIRNPNCLLLAFLASILNVIPYFGGILFGLVALLSAHSKKMFIRTLFAIFICSILDCYVINPLSFKKSNDINPIISIIAVMLFGSLFGVMGVILTIPLLIIVKEYFEYKRV